MTESSATEENSPTGSGGLSGEILRETEARMRHRALSFCGFIGRSDELSSVIAHDLKTLDQYGVTCGQLARELGRIVAVAMNASQYGDQGLPPIASPRDGDLDTYRHFPRYEVPPFFEVSWIGFMGYQKCPFLNPDGSECGSTALGAYEIHIQNTRSNKGIRFGGLLIHLIGTHQFFEGRDMYYRLDPGLAIEALELGTSEQEVKRQV